VRQKNSWLGVFATRPFACIMLPILGGFLAYGEIAGVQVDLVQLMVSTVIVFACVA
jgi:hypothetical protein